MVTLWYLAAVLTAMIVTSFTDWYFMGVLFHDRYMTHPEIWRVQPGDRKSERLAIAWSTLVGLFSCAMFIHVYEHFSMLGWLARLLVSAACAHLFLG